MGDNFQAAAEIKRAETQYVLEEIEWMLGNGANVFEISEALHRTVSALARMTQRHRPDLSPPFQAVMTEQKSRSHERGRGW